MTRLAELIVLRAVGPCQRLALPRGSWYYRHAGCVAQREVQGDDSLLLLRPGRHLRKTETFPAEQHRRQNRLNQQAWSK